jgi:regulatory protein
VSTITSIEQAKKNAKRYHIYVNEQYTLSVHEDVLVKFGLHKGMEVDAHELETWLTADETARIRQAVYHYLSYRARSAQEVRDYLRRKEWEPELIEQVITEFTQQGYIDDRAFAENWVRSRQARQGLGKNRLRQELQKKGISRANQEEVLTQLDEEVERQQARELAERRYLRIQGEAWPKVERKIGQYLLRRGYQMDMVYSILRELREKES